MPFLGFINPGLHEHKRRLGMALKQEKIRSSWRPNSRSAAVVATSRRVWTTILGMNHRLRKPHREQITQLDSHSQRLKQQHLPHPPDFLQIPGRPGKNRLTVLCIVGD